MEFPDDSDIYGAICNEASEDACRQEHKFASIDQRLNNMEIVLRDVIQRIDSMEKILGVGSKNNPILANKDFPEEWSLRTEYDYINFIKTKISHLRNNFEWRSVFAGFHMDGLTDKQKYKIENILTKEKGDIKVSRIVNTIAVELIGVENIKNYLIGVHGATVKQGHDKRPTLPLDQENRLRTFFSFIDKVFISPNGWEYLVRKPVNQMGREYYSGKRKANTQSQFSAESALMHSYFQRQPTIHEKQKKALTSSSLANNLGVNMNKQTEDTFEKTQSPDMATATNQTRFGIARNNNPLNSSTSRNLYDFLKFSSPRPSNSSNLSESEQQSERSYI